MLMNDHEIFDQAVVAIASSSYTVAFTGAGISVESGIPPFRGEKGIWNKYDPRALEIDYFLRYPRTSWEVIIEIFYEFFGNAKPNSAHLALSRMESAGRLQAVITQNIDNLHQEAGSREVYEFHGSSRKLVCTGCGNLYEVGVFSWDILPVACPDCRSLVKPDFVFFGEGIPPEAYSKSLEAAARCKVMVVVGTTAEVMPAGQLPWIAKSNGARIIEINPEPSRLTREVTDIFLRGDAGPILSKLAEQVLEASL